MNIVPVPVDYKPISDFGKHFLDKMHAMGAVLYDPKRIRKKADADAYAVRVAAQAEIDTAVIRLEGQIKLTDLQRRALSRVAYEAAREQENIEAIADKALGLLYPARELGRS